MVPVIPSAVTVDFDNARAHLRVSGLAVFDDHDLANSLTYGQGLPGDPNYPYPAITPVVPVRATIAFDVAWEGLIAEAQIRNTAQHFAGTFLQTGATISWSVEQEGFRFASEAPDPTRNLLSVLGREHNGVFFT